MAAVRGRPLCCRDAPHQHKDTALCCMQQRGRTHRHAIAAPGGGGPIISSSAALHRKRWWSCCRRCSLTAPASLSPLCAAPGTRSTRSWRRSPQTARSRWRCWCVPLLMCWPALVARRCCPCLLARAAQRLLASAPPCGRRRVANPAPLPAAAHLACVHADTPSACMLALRTCAALGPAYG